MNTATSAEASPTKIDVSEPLIVFASTSRPHLSPPKGSVAARSAAAATGPPLALSALMSAMTSASGSTDLPASPAAGAPCFLRLDVLHHVGQRIDDGGLVFGAGGVLAGASGADAGAAGVPASMSAPRNDGAA